MIRLLFLCCSFSGFAQVEQGSNFSQSKMNVNDSIQIQQDDGLLGYQFYHGSFFNSSLTNNLKLQTGFLYTNTTNNILVIDVPILLRYKINNKFQAFFGSKLNVSVKDGLSTFQPLEIGSKGIGVSGEFGLQYDVNDNLMLEMRYSSPILKQSVNDPSTINYYSGSLFKLGSRFKF